MITLYMHVMCGKTKKFGPSKQGWGGSVVAASLTTEA